MKKVLILCPYSFPSACGVWVRAFSDAKTLKDAGFDVYIFSSNRIKGTKESSGNYEEVEGIKVYRFPVLFSLGGTSMFWFFALKFLKINPQIIHTHGFRHPHSITALILGKLLRKKVFLTTHAPFEKDPKRSIILKLFDFFYDILIAWWELRLYNKVIRISEWEEKYLKRLGMKGSVFIPNGIDQKFIDLKRKTQNAKQILYMGRVDPVKRLDLIITAAKRLKEYKFKIWGPNHGYSKLKSESENLEIILEKYSKEEYVNELDKSSIYILPSVREAFSLTTLEAMARGVIPVVSKTAKGPQDFIKNGINGFIFKDLNDLVEKIRVIQENPKSKVQNPNDIEKFKSSRITGIRQQAKKTAKEFVEDEVNKKLVQLYNE